MESGTITVPIDIVTTSNSNYSSVLNIISRSIQHQLDNAVLEQITQSLYSLVGTPALSNIELNFTIPPCHDGLFPVDKDIMEFTELKGE